MSVRYPQLEARTELTPGEFRARYRGRRAVLLRGGLGPAEALERFSTDYLRRHAGRRTVKVKDTSRIGGSQVRRTTLAGFLDSLESGPSAAGDLPYLHDTPLLTEDSPLLADLGDGPARFLPRWYRRDWWRFALFFIGAAGSVTPLHFDTLETHNLFFQVGGRKRFIVVPPESRACCYPRDWRWGRVDAEAPDARRFPLFAAAGARECTVEPGDLLYLPPGAFHQVRGLDATISFNLDWHTRQSAWRGVAAILRGMPASGALTNSIHAIGLTTGIPARALLPLLERHLETVD